MKKIILLFLFYIALFSTSDAQVFFQKVLGKNFAGRDGYYCSSVQPANDGYIIIGHHGVTADIHSPQLNISLAKIDFSGDLIWAQNYYGIGDMRANSGQQTKDGGFIIAGSASGKILLLKTNSRGDIQWSKMIGGDEGEIAYSIQQTFDAGYIIGGSSGASQYNGSLRKTDSNGNLQWSKTFSGNEITGGYSVQQTIDSGYIFTGSARNGIFLIKTDINGDTLWTRILGVDGNLYGTAYSIKQTIDGGYAVTGGFYLSTAVAFDVFLLKTDQSGNILWTKTYGGGDWDFGYSVQQTSDGAYIIAGKHSRNSVYLIKTDEAGDTLWIKYFGSGSGNSVYQTSDKGYIIGATTNSFGSNSENEKIYLIKTDSMGNGTCNEKEVYGTWITTVKSHNGSQYYSPITISSGGNSSNVSPTIGDGPTTMNTLCYSGYKKISENIFIYPNPTSAVFSISFQNVIENGTLEIFNTLGQKIKEEKINKEIWKEIDLNFSHGIFFVKIHNGENTFSSKVIVF